jgi:hypothetical protein
MTTHQPSLPDLVTPDATVPAAIHLAFTPLQPGQMRLGDPRKLGDHPQRLAAPVADLT